MNSHPAMWKFRLQFAAVAVLVRAAFSGTAVAGVPDEARVGAELFADSSYQEAADAFRQATIASPDDLRWRYDLGLSEALGQDFENALNHLGLTASQAPPEVAGASNYNAGNVHMAMNNFAEAAGAYRQALVRNPGDVDAKHNLELALKNLQQQQQQQKQSGSQNDSTQNEKQKKEDSKQKDQQQKQKQDQKQDQKQQDKKDQQDDQKNPEDSQQPPQDSSGQEPPPDPGEQPPTDSTLSRDQAERILRALADEEARLRDQAKKVMGIPAPGGKDW